MKSFLSFLVFFVTYVSNGYSQKWTFNAALEFSTKYMWRGIEYGDAPTVFPSLNVSYKNFSAFAMGGYSINGSHQEVDLGISYSKNGITIGVSDYYYPSSVGEKDQYFKLSNRDTGHFLEGYVTFAPSSLPCWITFSSYFFGADKNLEGKQAYSSYLEAGYQFHLKGEHDISLFMGANLNKGFYTDYQKGFNIVNIGAKISTFIPFGTFKLPVSASYIINPYLEKSFVTFSFYLNS